MRLIWKKYDSTFDPIVTAVGFGFFIGGACGAALLAPGVLRRPVVMVLAAVLLVMAAMGVVMLVREYQLWKLRHAPRASSDRASESKSQRAEFPRNLGITGDGKKRKVLVVDDERTITDTLAIILNQYGFDVSVAYDGVGAVECAERIRPEFVIMGVMMPGMNGVEAATRICKRLPSCKLFLMSGSGRTELLESARAEGYEFEWLAKPLPPLFALHWLSVEGTHDVRSCSWCKEHGVSSGTD